MAIYKNANLDISVAAEQNPNYNAKPSVQFSTQDKNTAKYTFTVKQNNKPVDLTGVKASVTLYSEDKSVFQSDANITNATEGKIEYVIPSEAIRHHGKTRGDLRLTYPNGDVLGGLRFTFNIEQALIDRAAGTVGGVYIRDFETLKAEIQKTADSIKDIDVVRIDTKLIELEQKVEEGGAGVDEQARQEIEGLTEQLAEQANKVYTKNVSTTRPLVSFYLDDGYQNDYTIVYPKTKSLNIPVTICLHSDSYLTVNPDKLKELVTNGWEVHGHTVKDEDVDRLPYEQQYQTMKENKELLESMGYEVKGLCYPRGRTNADTLKATRALFEVGMSSVPKMNTSPIDTYFVGRILTDEYNMNEMKSLVDKIKADGRGWLVFYSHSNIYNTNTTVRDRYFEMLDYVAASGVETVTVKEAMKTYANTLDIGDKEYNKDYLKVGADGSINFSSIPIKTDTLNQGINARKGNDFPPGRLSINKFVVGGAASDIPFDNGFGTLYTDRLFEDEKYTGTRATQRFEGVNGALVTRFYNSGDGGWSDWLSLGQFNTVKTKAYKNDSPITDFPRYKVTTTTFISSDNSGIPYGQGIGTLITSRLNGNDLLNYQIFYPYNSTRFYRRVWLAEGWSAWVHFVSSTVTVTEEINFGTVPANGSVTKTVPVPSVGVSDGVAASAHNGIADGLILNAHITGNNTVQIKVFNVTGAPIALNRAFNIVITKW